ncbi:MAG: DUF1573 domain-containing protein [Planctomycetales bacterium]
MLRRLCLFALVLLSSASACPGQEWARKMFSGTSHAFGTVPQGSETKHYFKFKNLYKETIHVAMVRTTCGCTTPRITKDTLKTYEEGSIEAVFNTRSFLGTKSATLTVIIDQPFYAEVQLNVSGTIRNDLVLTPGRLNLGAVDQGSKGTGTTKIQHYGFGDWKIAGIASPNEHLTAKAVPLSSPRGKVEYLLEVTLSDKAPVGYLKDSLMVTTNELPPVSFSVHVEAQVRSAVTVSPSSLFFGAVRQGDQIKKNIIVKGKRPFKVLSIKCADDCFEFGPPSETAKTLHIVPVTLDARHEPGKVTQRIVIHTDLGEDAAVEFQAFAQITKG